ncbi:MAG TPA: sulfite exporter TauE/SafE family protein [Actinobacteria bacterium]|nr:sulfite exporter TauE/SafE family protein [Actinomycetota bacterium]
MAETGLLITLFLIGLVGAFFSGLLGLGGAIILVPLLLYLPPLIGVGALTMKEVSGITIIVVFASALTGVLTHNKNRLVSRSLVLVMGVTAAFTALLGSIYSKQTSSETLLVIFAFMAAFAAIIMWVPKKEVGEGVAPEDVTYIKIGAFLISVVIGFIGGMVGAPGAYIFTPLMIYFLGIPTKIAIGSTLGIAFAASIFGAIGKLTTGQVPYLLTLAVVIGAVPGARIGAKFTKKVPAASLKKALGVVIAFAAIRMWLDVLYKLNYL